MNRFLLQRGSIGYIAIWAVALAGIGAVLMYTQPILVPLSLALITSILVLPLVKALIQRKVPSMLAILVGELAALLPVLGFLGLFLTTAGPVSNELPKYQEALVLQGTEALAEVVRQFSPNTVQEDFTEQLMTDLMPSVVTQAVSLAQQSVTEVTVFLGNLFLVFLFSTFILLEARRFREKIEKCFGEGTALMTSLARIEKNVRAYVLAKALMSLLTGLAVWAFLSVMGVDFAFFWGVLAFPLNFIPTVGALVASVPPILLALIDPEMSSLSAMTVLVGLTLINAVIGSYLEPRFVGRSVQLSPLVVFLSMVIWLLLWGPMGMLLAVPIMVSLKIICSHIDGLRAVATLMEP